MMFDCCCFSFRIYPRLCVLSETLAIYTNNIMKVAGKFMKAELEQEPMVAIYGNVIFLILRLLSSVFFLMSIICVGTLFLLR